MSHASTRTINRVVAHPPLPILCAAAVQVLNMKPHEILGMIEEAAGTRMFENKKQAALKTIEKKSAKVRERLHPGEPVPLLPRCI